MGLLDVLNGMQNGPRGPSTPGKGGMSPLTMALLGLLAYKAVKKLSANSASATPAGSVPASGGGGLGGLLSGLLAGGAAGSVLSGGLGDIVKQLQDSGHGEKADSWVGPGTNKAIAPNDLASALGADQISALMSHSGLSRDELLQGLSQHLPEVINQLTPEGRLPTEQEATRLL